MGNTKLHPFTNPSSEEWIELLLRFSFTEQVKANIHVSFLNSLQLLRAISSFSVDLDPEWSDIPTEYLAEKGAWQTSCLNFLEKIFGADNVYVKKFDKTLSYSDESQMMWELELLRSAKDDVEKGFVYRIEHLISADLFGSIIEQAEYLLKNGFKDVAAVLGRVVIENTLKDIAKREKITVPEKKKLSDLNTLLWKEGVYDKPKWRSIQAQVDLGNYAAHGDFDKYDEKSVENMLIWIRETLMSPVKE
jgi:hypothetical protein